MGVGAVVLLGLVVTLSQLHVGSGRAAVGADLPVERDASGAPLIPAGSLRGVIRRVMEREAGQEDAKKLFGARIEVVVSRRTVPEEGSVGFTDAYLVAYPERGPSGIRLRLVEHNLARLEGFLEELGHSVSLRGAVEGLLSGTGLPIAETITAGPGALGVFTRMRVALDPRAKTVREGHLWELETVPAWSVFAFLVACYSEDCKSLRDALNGRTLTLGGMETTGHGLVRLHLEALESGG